MACHGCDSVGQGDARHAHAVDRRRPGSGPARGRRPLASTEHRSHGLLRATVAEPELFALFYDRFAEQVLRHIARQTFDVHVAFDLHAETFAMAFERRAQFRGTTVGEEHAWLFTIAQRELHAYWRRGRVRREAMARLCLDRPDLDDEAIQRLEELAELEALRPRLAAALDGLRPGQRLAIELRVIEELGYEEISMRLNVSHDVARARVSRGLRALHRALEDPPAPQAGGGSARPQAVRA